MNFCFVKNCKYYGREGEIDCILHYIEATQEAINTSKQALDSSQRSLNIIIEHYKALRKPRTTKPLNVRNEETEKEKDLELKRKRSEHKLKNPFLWAKTRKLNDENNSSSSSPENTGQKKLDPARVKTKLRNDHDTSKEISPKVSPATKSWRTSSNRVPVKSPLEQVNNSNNGSNQSKSKRVSLNSSSKHNDAILEQGSFTFSQSVNGIENEYLRLVDEKANTPNEKRKEARSNTVTPEVVIKKEKKSPAAAASVISSSPDIFSSDDIIFVEPEDKIYTVAEFSPNPAAEEAKAIAAVPWKKDKYLDKFIDTPRSSPKLDSFNFVKRERFEGECFDCEIFYDDVAEKKCAEDANMMVRHCSINCLGHQERCKKLQKENDSSQQSAPKSDEAIKQSTPKTDDANKLQQPLQNIRTKLDEIRKRRAKGLLDDDIDPNATPRGFWDINISPRRRSPVRRPVKNPYFSTQEIDELEAIFKE